MKVPQGGTQKWCPNCKETQVVSAVNASRLGAPSGQRWYKVDHEDIQYFRRGQICQACSHEWLSAEVPEAFLDELVELRVALRDIKSHAETYSRQSTLASQSLEKLSKSLSVLRALDIYKAER